MRYWDSEKRDPGQLFDLQGSPSPRSRMVHPDGQENLAKSREVVESLSLGGIFKTQMDTAMGNCCNRPSSE